MIGLFLQWKVTSQTLLAMLILNMAMNIHGFLQLKRKRNVKK